MNTDKRIEIIRKVIERKYKKCQVNRGPDIVMFYCGDRTETPIGYENIFCVSKEFIEVLPLVDKKEKN